jgi:hypothetical protein
MYKNTVVRGPSWKKCCGESGHDRKHSVTKSCALVPSLGFATDVVDSTPDATEHVHNGGCGRGPPEKRVSHEVHVMVGLFAREVVQAAVQKGPGPRQGLTTTLLCLAIVKVSIYRRAQVIVGPPHHPVDLDELLEEGQRFVRQRFGRRRYYHRGVFF